MNRNGFKVRSFEARDQAGARETILAGLREHFGFINESLNPDLDDIESSYVSRGDLFLVAESSGIVIGTAGLVFEEPGTCRVVRMSVRRESRRQGVANAMLGVLLVEARTRSLREITVRTEPDWEAAVSFYQRAGFEQYGADAVDVHLRRAP